MARPKEPAREWTPRIWEGCDFFAWSRLLFRNRFAVDLSLVYIAIVVTVISGFHTLLRWLQNSWLGDRPERTPIRQAPIFIIGHWRTGTTLLHELLILDDRHTYPNTYQCLEPNHFLLTERLFTRLFWFLMPSHRPMDNMKVGWDRPQEDEFALCMIGQPSPYWRVAFPNSPGRGDAFLDLEAISPRAREDWKAALGKFLRQLNFKNPGRLVLKSPTHSCRIRTLLEMFPNARFVHIVRNPYVVFPSTVRLWKSLYETHGLQRPRFRGLEEYVFQTFTHLYDKLEEGKRLVPPEHFYELRYEDLIRDPLEEMRKLYKHLSLGEFDRVLPRLEEYFRSVVNYETNRHELAPTVKAEISRRWGPVIARYGYGEPAPAKLPSPPEPRTELAVSPGEALVPVAQVS